MNDKRFSIVNSSDHKVVKLIKLQLERFMGIARLYSEIADVYGQGDILTSDLLKDKEIKLEILGRKHLFMLDASDAPVVILFNHPHGLIDGLILGHLLKEICKTERFKFLGNEIIIKLFKSLEKHVIPINNMSAASSKRAYQNSRALIKVIKFLKENNIILIAPAGEVSDLKVFSREGIFKVTDGRWAESFVQVLINTRATVIPIHISGRNSNTFQVASFFGQTAKRLLNFREFLSYENKVITLTVRDPIYFQPDFERYSKNKVVQIFRDYLYKGKGIK